MAELKPFTFDVSFDDEALAHAEAEAARAAAEAEEEEQAQEEEVAAATFTEEEMDAARDEGFEAGKEAGIREAADAIETKINDALGMLGTNLEELFRRQAIDAADTFTDAVNIAVAIARKCLPNLNETHGFDEIERMVKEVLTEVLEEPRVLIHIHPALKEALEERITNIARASNFEGQVLILEDEQIAPGDCRITWSSGAAERDVAGTLGKIDQIVTANLGSVKEEVVETVAENGVDVPMPSKPVAPPADPTEQPDAESLEGDSPDTDTPEPEAVIPDAADLPDEAAAALATAMQAMPDVAAAPEPMEDLPEPQESADFGDADTISMVDPDDEQLDPTDEAVIDVDTDTGSHLAAGAGIVEPESNEAILDGDDEPDDGAPPGGGDTPNDDVLDFDDDDDVGTPPSVPNF